MNNNPFAFFGCYPWCSFRVKPEFMAFYASAYLGNQLFRKNPYF